VQLPLLKRRSSPAKRQAGRILHSAGTIAGKLGAVSRATSLPPARFQHFRFPSIAIVTTASLYRWLADLR
jgi:hypothetical protein